jgi:hypothetical protein
VIGGRGIAMPEQKHTPGPWEYLGDPEERECRVRQATSVRRGNGYLSELTICESVSSEANAKLITAAPELLEACIQARAVLHTALAEIEDETGIRVVQQKIALLSAVISTATD